MAALTSASPAAPIAKTGDDPPTLGALGVLAYVSSDLIHEALGHGGACLATGSKVVLLTTVNLQCSAATRLMVAAGPAANLVAGLLLWLLLRRLRSSARASLHRRCFLWLAMAFNLLNLGAYLVYSGVLNSGDMAVVMRGVEPEWPWRAAFIVLGGLAYVLCVRITAGELQSLLGDDRSAARVRRFTLVPYLAAGAIACLAALFNPVGIFLLWVAAAPSSFGTNAGLLALPALLGAPRAAASAAPATPPAHLTAYLTRSWGWIIAAVLVLLVFVAVIGPGLRLQS